MALIFSVYSILNAFTNIPLTRKNRLILSIWSTIIMFAFAVDNIIRVFSNEDIEITKYSSQGFYIGLQYFLLGISAVYLMQNFILLLEYVPSRDGNYRRYLMENNENHINRYSDKQVITWQSLFCILYTGIIYGFNYKCQILPRHTAIWLVFFTFPLILQLMGIISVKINTNRIR